MMSNIQRILSTLRYLTCGLVAAAPVHAAQIVPSNQPLFLNQSVAPNILVTLDDSGSMQSGYTPDSHSDKNKVYFKSPQTGSAILIQLAWLGKDACPSGQTCPSLDADHREYYRISFQP